MNIETDKKYFFAAISCFVLAMFCYAGSKGNENMATLFTLFNIAAAAICVDKAIRQKYNPNNTTIKIGDTPLPFIGRYLQFILYLVIFTIASKTLSEVLQKPIQEIRIMIWDTFKSSVLGFRDTATGLAKDGVEETLLGVPIKRFATMIVGFLFAYRIFGTGFRNAEVYQTLKDYLGRAFVILIVIAIVAGITYLVMEWLNPSFYSPMRSTIASHMNLSLVAVGLFALAIAALPFIKKGSAAAED